MTPEANAILHVFRSRPRLGAHIEIMDFGESIAREAGLSREQFLAGLDFLHEHEFTKSGAIGEFLTSKCIQYIEASWAEEVSGEFAYEKDLRNFLAKNLSVIEPGLELYQKGEKPGIEFPAGGRYIDLLAVDRENRLVVIELKVSMGYDRAVGQLLRYMGWIKTHLADAEQRVRGIIVAREISEDLRYACLCVSSVALFEYQLSVTMNQVNPCSRIRE